MVFTAVDAIVEDNVIDPATDSDLHMTIHHRLNMMLLEKNVCSTGLNTLLNKIVAANKQLMLDSVGFQFGAADTEKLTAELILGLPENSNAVTSLKQVSGSFEADTV